jgi:ribose-phosphate pyrophosphokinase
MKLLTGNSNKTLSKKIAKYLKSKLVNSSIRKFSDGEIYIEINENIRGNSIFIIQSISSPANDNLMELLLCIDALKRSSAKNITAVIPYFGYARQDRKVVPRTSISAKLVSNLITKAGADRVVTVDLHAGQIQGFFDIPVDNLFATPIFARHVKKNIKKKNIICVAPDVGGTERARALGKILNVGLAIVDKRRPKPGQSKVMNVIGNVKGKTCIIVDDIIDSGGTIVNAAKALKDKGAIEVYVYITHGVLSGEAVEKIKKSVIKNLVITDTIDNHEKIKKAKNIEVLPISGLMGEAIKRISNSTSVSDLFK